MTPDYKLAAKRKYRFNSPKGQLTVDDLYDLTLEQLDSMAQSLDKSLKDAAGNSSFIPGATKSKGILTDRNKLAILVDVIQTKVADANLKKERAEKSQKLSHLRELLADKMNDETRQKSVDEIKRMIAELEDED